ncbi:MAG: NAD(P)/FAD-dependent oxidoreductase [Acidobacteria bacterium]|nr:NAD(P)/FAD-dependent oxidoreductase [Acidobacteriota bacterium]
MSAPTRLVVLGAGFGGLEAVLELERRFRDDPGVEILLVSENNFFLFTPLLPQIVSSYIEPRHIVQSIRDIRRQRRFRFLRARITGLDLARRRVDTSAGELPFDYLIIGLGSVPNFFGIEGAEHCFPLASLEQAVVLRDHILDLLEHADHEPDPERKRAWLTLTVVGGGYTGVEVVAELRDLLYTHVAPHYRGISLEHVKLLLLEATPEVLVGVDPKLAARARRRLEQKGIELRTEARVTRVRPGQVELKSGETIETGLVIWTAGIRANPLLETLPGEKNKAGRVVVTPYLHLPDFPRVFAIGDNAVVRAAPAEHTVQVAPLAIEQARVAAENVARGVARQAYVTFEFKPKGMLVSLGMNDAVVNLMGFKLSGYLAWLFWNAVHLLKLVGLKKQVQVALDWSLATLFPRDTSIIRAPRRCRLCHPEAGAATPR